MKLKDPTSSLLHFFGAVLAIPGFIYLLLKGLASPWKIVSFSIYFASLFLLLFFSALYHALPQGAGGKYQIFRKFDHIFIYILIAGTYTPFCLVTLNGTLGWTFFAIEWGLALAGTITQSFYINAPRWLTTAIYLGMGWIVVMGFKPLHANLGSWGVLFLVSGGIIYSLGGLIYALKKPNISKYFNFHDLWHVFVLGGAFMHFLAIYFFVA